MQRHGRGRSRGHSRARSSSARRLRPPDTSAPWAPPRRGRSRGNPLQGETAQLRPMQEVRNASSVMAIMRWLASISFPARSSAGSTEAGPSMTFVTGIHFAMVSGMRTVRSPAPTEARAPRHQLTLKDGAARGPSSVTGRPTGAPLVIVNMLLTTDFRV
eukprot:3296507-Pyramimonas_sp.AAC.1